MAACDWVFVHFFLVHTKCTFPIVPLLGLQLLTYKYALRCLLIYTFKLCRRLYYYIYYFIIISCCFYHGSSHPFVESPHSHSHTDSHNKHVHRISPKWLRLCATVYKKIKNSENKIQNKRKNKEREDPSAATAARTQKKPLRRWRRIKIAKGKEVSRLVFAVFLIVTNKNENQFCV